MTAPIVPGEISWPWAISSDSSFTTSRATSMSRSSPSRVSMLPLRNTSHARWVSSDFSTASSEPASSVATSGSSVIWLRTIYPASCSFTSSLTRRPSARPCAFAITADITFPISFGDCAPVSATASATSR